MSGTEKILPLQTLGVQGVVERLVELLEASVFLRRGSSVRPKKDPVARMLDRIGIGQWSRQRASSEELEKYRIKIHELGTVHARKYCGDIPKCASCILLSLCNQGLKRARSKRPKGALVVDVFSGAGSLSAGFVREKFRVVLAIEKWRHAAQTYRFNHPGIPLLEIDARRVTSEKVLELTGLRRGDITAVIGGPPCQGYSAAGLRRPRRSQNLLYEVVGKLARSIGAPLLVMENVPGLKKVDGVDFQTQILSFIRRMGFARTSVELDSSEFGVPQKRRRLIFYGVRRDWDISPKALAPIAGSRTTRTVISALKGLPALSAGQGHDFMRRNGKNIFNHKAMAHGKLVVSKIARIKAGEGPISYKRLPRSLAHTLVAGHRAMPVHPTQNRTITVREAARIQTLPDEFRFLGPHSEQPLQVANAVPYRMARAIARSIRKRIIRRRRQRK